MLNFAFKSPQLSSHNCAIFIVFQKFIVDFSLFHSHSFSCLSQHTHTRSKIKLMLFIYAEHTKKDRSFKYNFFEYVYGPLRNNCIMLHKFNVILFHHSCMVEEHHKSFYDVVYVFLLLSSRYILAFIRAWICWRKKSANSMEIKNLFLFLKHIARKRHNELSTHLRCDTNI